MITRFLSPSLHKTKKSILLLGPRQVGKSTILSELKPELTINLANETEFLSFATNPGEIESRIAEAKPKTIFVDEVQRLPSLLNTIQALIDEDKSKRFFLSGSSARKLRRGQANLLPGRIFSYKLGPLSCLELDFKMDTQKALELGTLPEPYIETRTHAEKLLRSYTATYLREEILAESLTKQIQGFSRFLQIAAETSGQFLDFSKLASKAKVNRSAARRYYDLLEDTLLCDRVEAFQKDEIDLVKHPKYYFFDIGVVNGVLQNFKASADRVGTLMEHLFFNQLKNTSYCLDLDLKISHFRTRNGLEVDFVVEHRGITFLIEVKNSSPSGSELSPLLAAKEYFSNSVECFVACAAQVSKRVKDIRILHWQDVIKSIFEL